MEKTAITKLQQDLFNKVVSKLKVEHAKVGDSLNESSLAQQFEVSRTPMRAVLTYMSALGIAKAVPYKGFVLQLDAQAIKSDDVSDKEESRQEKLYLRLLMDLFFGDIDAAFSEKELQERYNANRGEIQSVLRLLESDGILRRSPGYKWHLDGVLNTLERHTESYRCRLIFEPAGLLEPSWSLDRHALEECRVHHLKAIQDPDAVSASELFNLSAQFHERIAACSGNRFLLGNMQQHNRMRKATDLVSMHIQSSVTKSCQRRLDIIELVLAGDNQGASAKLTQLLENDIRVMQRTYSNVVNLSLSERDKLVTSIADIDI
ncbi:GntR family transcriptional regulator [Vibrio europaeus]|uniref:Transcriptional regulator n=1 Tax=Vibrio europaeus TaxID=300876 RepID=A0A178J768_9VIBR|nr:GntR family transcriptional regulator [Vibrio europaeus]MDC5705854.1 GntR family transcriptional regulator [Vibrio europaeus]MDC5709264.1 GntR family transcriptional regulator [Vibrio europaeus]MDC5713663.1 GntR family transcriptional regulator [Vibrio europaeus]MDC5720383.1 GntR family transcriptional regulator [Vibrio europaeus]MDC5723730.1 GntR family transcriptional regulator [Vibrio europaeus]